MYVPIYKHNNIIHVLMVFGHTSYIATFATCYVAIAMEFKDIKQQKYNNYINTYFFSL